MTTPTVVMGIGQAGVRMLSSVHETVESEGQMDSFLFIPIDTNESDLDREKPKTGNVRDVALYKPESRWKSSRSDFFYLDEDYQIERQDGTGQSRPVSRFHVDSDENLGRVKEILRQEITEFISDRDLSGDRAGSDFNIWLLNSLGGGTGSGSFPVIAGIVHSVTASMDETATINGIASMPSLEDMNPLYDPAGANKLYANTYAALAELRALINDYDDDDWRAPDIELLNAGQSLRPTSPLDDDLKLFHKYWLVGFDEGEKDTTGYRRRKNQIAADMVQYYANKDEIEDFPYSDNALKEETLAAVSSGKLFVPIEDLREVIALREEIDDLESDMDRLNDEIGAFDDAASFYAEVLDIQLRVDGIPDELDYVTRDVPSDCLKASSQVKPKDDVQDVEIQDHTPDREALEEILAEKIDVKLDSNETDIWSPEPIIGGETPAVESREVIAYFYCDILKSYLNQVLREHRFAEEIEELWTGEFGEAIEDYAALNHDQLDNSAPDVKWEGALEDFIPDHGENLVERHDNTLRPWTRWNLSQRIKRLRSYNNNLPDLYEQYKKIKVYQDVVATRFSIARDNLREARKRTQQTTDEKREVKEETFDDLEADRDDLESLVETLTEAGPLERRANGEYRPLLQNIDSLSRSDVYPVVDVGVLHNEGLVSDATLDAIDEAAIDADDPADATLPVPTVRDLGIYDGDEADIPESAYVFRPSIGSLVDSGFIGESVLVQELTDLVGDSALTDDPVQDIKIEPPVDVDTQKFLGVVANEANVSEDGPVGNLLELDVGHRPSAVEEMDNEEFSYIGVPVDSNDRFTLRLLSWFMPIALENSSEFGKLDEHFRDENRSIEDDLNVSNLSDDFVARSFAYPEVVEETNIWARYSKLSDRTP